MQDRYSGDIGDYVKLAILRSLAPGYRLGVGWWLYPNESHNADGRHIGYLDQPQTWRAFDPVAFDHLKFVVASGERGVAALEHDDLLPGAVYFRDLVPTDGASDKRRLARMAWLGRLSAAVESCDLVFLDPDNGFETKGFDLGARKAGKSVALSELGALRRPGRTLLVYHHQTRMRGGHERELEHWGERLLAAPSWPLWSTSRVRVGGRRAILAHPIAMTAAGGAPHSTECVAATSAAMAVMTGPPVLLKSAPHALHPGTPVSEFLS